MLWYRSLETGSLDRNNYNFRSYFFFTLVWFYTYMTFRWVCSISRKNFYPSFIHNVAKILLKSHVVHCTAMETFLNFSNLNHFFVKPKKLKILMQNAFLWRLWHLCILWSMKQVHVKKREDYLIKDEIHGIFIWSI